MVSQSARELYETNNRMSCGTGFLVQLAALNASELMNRFCSFGKRLNSCASSSNSRRGDWYRKIGCPAR